MTVGQILNELNRIAPFAYQENYDNSGLLVGDAGMDVTKTLLTLDCTEEVVEEALKLGCNLIIAHHPIVFSGLKQLTGKDYVQRTVIKAIKSDIAIIAIHTNLDNVIEGVGQIAVQAFGLKNVRVLQPKSGLFMKLFAFVPVDHVESVRTALFAAGAGVIGKYDECSFGQLGEGTFKAGNHANPFVGSAGQRHIESELKLEVILPAHAQRRVIEALTGAHPYEEVAYDLVRLDNGFETIGSGIIGELEQEVDEIQFLQQVKKEFNCSVIKHTPLRNKSVRKVAFCGGSGAFLRHTAMAQGADIFITGDVKYHEFFDADGQMIFADIGHYESEQFVPRILAEFLKQKFSTFAFHFSEVNTNPVKYLA